MHRRPVVGRPIAKQDRHLAVGRRRGLRRAPAAKAAGGRPKSCWKVSLNRRTLPKPDASATSRHRQARLVDQLLGEQDAPRLGHRHRRGAEMLAKEAAELALADPQPLGQGLHVAAIQATLSISGQRPRDGVGRAAPGAEIGRGLGPAAQAGAEARLLGRRGRRIEAACSRAWACAPGRPAGSRCRSSSPPKKSRPSKRASRVQKAR